MLAPLAALLSLTVPSISAHSHAAPATPVDVSTEAWFTKYGAQDDLGYTGPLSFNHLPYARCLEDASRAFDIALLGMPFDTTTSYRPGARFGPQAIRVGSGSNGYTLAWDHSALDWGARIMDCGDVPTTMMDNAMAIDQMEVAYSTLLGRPVSGETKASTAALSKDGQEHPRIVTLGGDHTIVLPILRALYKVYGPISVIHFDAHYDTAAVEHIQGPGRISHGSYFTLAHEEGLLTNTSIHGGIRQKSSGCSRARWLLSTTRQSVRRDLGGGPGRLRDRGCHPKDQGTRRQHPVYLSLDIDTRIDPGWPPPVPGTPEIGGWTTREMKRIIRGLAGLNFVGADVVEVAPAYDIAEITSRAAAGLVSDFLVMMQADEPPRPHAGPFLELWN
ncbi:unnamed protein product [Mycena citricolor]|uniref:Arginase/deacetylase n=1 Tax=Mycena citricolor TaxID=2018698 RepID=A0AAD2HN37_9AGAR|nr:unnamed protein product [Mycena citricolor]